MKWREPRWYAFVLALVAATMGFYALYLDSALKHSLELKFVTLTLGGLSFRVPLLSLAVVGLVAVAASLGIYQARQIATSPRTDESVQRWLIMRALLWPLFIFAFILFIPSVIVTDWFWKTAGAASRAMTLLKDPLLNLTSTAQSIASMNSVESLALLQTAAVVLMALAALVTVRVRRLPVKKRR